MAKGTMQDAGMDMSDFFDTDLIKPAKKTKKKKIKPKKIKTSFLPHKIKDNRKNVT
jgi:hypothetical protein